ncbi:PadR family transcriptional regulator [Candidatus Acetothermia bacterium]|nr:PadR family transcriptional regulator [Candidatus Acetothermia bacterium]
MSLQHAILGLLSYNEGSGYDIKRAFEGPYGMVWRGTYGGIYPNLQTLTRDGLLTKRVIHQRGKPDRHMYVLTDRGRAELRKWLAEPQTTTSMGPRQDPFFLKFYLSHLLKPAEFEKLIHERMNILNGYLEFMENVIRAGENQGIPEQFFPPAYLEITIDSSQFFKGRIRINRFHWELIRLEAINAKSERDWLLSMVNKIKAKK